MPSYFKGNDILKFDTRHVISLIKVNDEKEELDQFIEYLLTDGQTAIKNQGSSLLIKSFQMP